jgi:putative transposase
MDFMHDALANGRTLRIFTLIDVHTRECLALKPATGFSGAAVAQILADVSVERPLPQRILVDNGTEFTSKALDAWAYWNKVKLDFSRRGKPGDNAHIEAFNSLVRRECLSQHWFTTFEEARGVLGEFAADDSGPVPGRSHHRPGPRRARNSQIGWIRKGVSCHEPETRRSGGSEKG